MNKELKEWTIAYLKNKDITQKRIVKIEDNEKNGFLNVVFKDRQCRHYISDKLDDKLYASISNNDFKTVVCTNSEDNFNFLIKNWKKLSEIKNLNMIFVNLKSHDKWLINPHVHAMIADPESIEQGLRTIYDTANGKIAEPPKSKKKQPMFEESSGSQDGEEGEEE